MAEAGEGDDAVFEVEETYNPLAAGFAGGKVSVGFVLVLC